MLQKITTFLMFDGEAEEMRFYTLLFADSEMQSISRHGPDEAGTEGTVQLASFVLAGRQFMRIDSAAQHDFAFTPSMSLSTASQTPRLSDCMAPYGRGPGPYAVEFIRL